jgi:hypothetical protein
MKAELVQVEKKFTAYHCTINNKTFLTEEGAPTPVCPWHIQRLCFERSNEQPTEVHFKITSELNRITDDREQDR